jgi:hypothetical protein
MQLLPHGLLLPGVQLGCVPLRQDDMNVCRADPTIREACALQFFIRSRMHARLDAGSVQILTRRATTRQTNTLPSSSLGGDFSAQNQGTAVAALFDEG